MTFKKAKELSEMKWEWFSKHGRWPFENFNHFSKRLKKRKPELLKLYFSCGFCAKYWPACEDCRLNKKWNMFCSDDRSPYKTWSTSRFWKSKVLARQILQDIKECQE